MILALKQEMETRVTLSLSTNNYDIDIDMFLEGAELDGEDQEQADD